MSMVVKFWGVRGTRPVPNQEMLFYGGNTPCVSIEIDDVVIILDAGSGLYDLGQYMLAQHMVNGHIFISHVHWDHIQGLPFFAPFYHEGNHFTIYGEKKKHQRFRTQIANLMKDPHFPITLNYIKRQIAIKEISSSSVIALNEEIQIECVASHHPNGALGFSVRYKGIKICYLCDYEHVEFIPNALEEWALKADLLIYDSNFTDEEYVDKKGWGHSTWREGIKFAEHCKIEQLALFHHDPTRTDQSLIQMEKEVQLLKSQAFFAKEGQTIAFL